VRNRINVPLCGGLFALTLSLGLVSGAKAQTLGPAAGYNVFTFGDHTASNVDVYGKVAVGGNANYTNYHLNSLEGPNSGTNSTVTTVVGGNFTNSNSSAHGSVVVGGNATWVNPTVFGNFSANGSVNFGSNGVGSVNGLTKFGTTYTGPGYINRQQGTTPLPIDFATAQATLTGTSNYLAGLTSDVTANTQYGAFKVDLTGRAAGTYVVSITDAELASRNYFEFNGTSDTSLVINVLRTNGNTTLSAPNTGTTFLGGMSFANILYNVADAGLTQINLAGSFNGSLLAPVATVNAGSGAFNGQIVTRTLNSNGLEFHSKNPNRQTESTLFVGNVPTRAIPEPGTVALVVASLPVFGLLRRRKG
jgi:choice-of-anchor A domain-containing protein